MAENLRYFFLNESSNIDIKIFGIYHFFLVFITFFASYLIIKNKKYFINMNSKKKKKMRIFLALLLIINLILRRGSYLYYGVYSPEYNLDIGFCNFTSIMFIIYGLTGSKKIYPICYYMAFVGPLLSIIFPASNFSWEGYSFYSFLIIHHLVFIFNIAFMFTEKLNYSLFDFSKTIKFLVAYFIVIIFINNMFNFSYNEPLEYVNSSIENLQLFQGIAKSSFLLYLLEIVIIAIQLMIGKIFLKYIKNKI